MQGRWSGGGAQPIIFLWVGLVVPPPKREEDEDTGVFSASLRVCAFSLSWGTRNSGTAARCREHGE